MKAKIEINMDNDAFRQPDELPRVLRNLARDLEDYPDATEIVIMDINGNSVGHYEFEHEDDWQGCSHFDGYPGY